MIGLSDEQVFELDAEFLGVDRVERVFGVDEGGQPAVLLGTRDDVQGQGRLARGLGAVDLADPSAWHALATKSQIERESAGRNALDRQEHVLAKAHDGTLAVTAFDLLQCAIECLVRSLLARCVGASGLPGASLARALLAKARALLAKAPARLSKAPALLAGNFARFLFLHHGLRLPLVHVAFVRVAPFCVCLTCR